jgi:BMFP domain-containing protein YqiC
MAAKARAENSTLAERLDALEARLAILEAEKATKSARKPPESPHLKK